MSSLMKLNRLPKTTSKRRKRVGRGYGSGKGGHTAGRGHKGQKARSRIRLGFEGGQTPLIQRLPLRRGKGNPRLSHKPLVVNVKFLNLLPPASLVTRETLIDNGLISASDLGRGGVKILGNGELNLPLKVHLPCSKGARKKIEAAGGEVVVSNQE